MIGIGKRRGRAVAWGFIAAFATAFTTAAALAASDGWKPVASTSVAHAGHTATLLPSGEVLVIGESVERYDPDRNIWRNGAPLSSRSGHTATLLPNGRVLVVGGLFDGSAGAGVQIYDPLADRWNAASDLEAPRVNQTATLLESGKVLVAGGSRNGAPVAAAELYDPATGAWTAAGTLATARYRHTAARLPSGRILVAGGFDATGAFSGTAEVYDPATNAWQAASAPPARASHTTTLLADGRLLAVGGDAQADNVEAYDSASDTWTMLASLAQARSGHTATLLPSGRLLVVGGQNAASEILTSAERYDPVSGSWSLSGTLASPRVRHTATLLASGKVLVVGGHAPDGDLASAELYDPATDAWSTAGAMAGPRGLHIATLTRSGKVLIIGGSGNGFALHSAELYDYTTDTWRSGGYLATRRTAATGTLLPSGKLLVAGGTSNGSTSFSSVELFDPDTGTAAPAANMAATRESHSSTLLADGRVLVVGGLNGSTVVTTAEIYDPAADAWQPVASPATPRGLHTATLLASGKVLIAGGFDGNVRTPNTEFYDPATNRWSAAGTLANGRYYHTATLLRSGKVLVAGGIGPGYIRAELYDPDTNAWSDGGMLTDGRYRQAAALLPSGEVLLAGGESGSYRLKSTDLYDPLSNSWRSAGPLASQRTAATATVLPDGNVLIVGDLFTSTATSERYALATGAAPARRPVVTAVTPLLLPGAAIAASGAGFDGDSEAGGGTSTSSTADSPLVELRRLDNDAVVHARPAADGRRSDSDWRSAPFGTAAAGLYALTVRVDGIAGVSQIVRVERSLLVTPLAGAGGTIDPATPQFVGDGATVGFTLSAEVGHHLDGVAGTCGGTLAGDVYTTAPVATDCSVVATFAADTFTLAYTAAAGGTLTGDVSQTVAYGGSGSPVTAVADVHHHFTQWSDGSVANPRVDAGVTANTDVVGTFAIDTFTVTATVAEHGSIGPVSQSVDYGSAATFVVVADAGYFATLVGDTCNVARVNETTWTSDAIVADCHVVATFSAKPVPELSIEVDDGRTTARYGDVLEYVVTVTNGGNGDATAVVLSNLLPAGINAASTSWVCSGQGSGAVCEPSGLGALNTTGVVIPAGRSLTWHVTAPVRLDAEDAMLDFAVTASNGDDVVQAHDVDVLVIFSAGFEASDSTRH